MITTLLIDDHDLYRRSLKTTLASRFPGLRIFEAENFTEGARKTRSLRPALVLLDIELPDGNGLNLARIARESNPGTKIVFVTNHDLPEYRQAANQVGCDYFIPKSSSKMEQVADLIRALQTGD